MATTKAPPVPDFATSGLDRRDLVEAAEELGVEDYGSYDDQELLEELGYRLGSIEREGPAHNGQAEDTADQAEQLEGARGQLMRDRESVPGQALVDVGLGPFDVGLLGLELHLDRLYVALGANPAPDVALVGKLLESLVKVPRKLGLGALADAVGEGAESLTDTARSGAETLTKPVRGVADTITDGVEQAAEAIPGIDSEDEDAEEADVAETAKSAVGNAAKGKHGEALDQGRKLSARPRVRSVTPGLPPSEPRNSPPLAASDRSRAERACAPDRGQSRTAAMRWTRAGRGSSTSS